MRKFAKIVVYGVLALCVALIAAIILGANYMFAYALDSQFGKGADVERSALEPNTPESWLVENSRIASIVSHDGLNLKAYFVPAAAPTDKLVLLVHGYKAGPTGMAHYAQRYHQHGWNVLVPHHRAHGDSQGRYIGMGYLEHFDMLGWLSLVTDSQPEAQIVMHGVSMGAATVMLATGSADLPPNVRLAVADCGYSTVTAEFTHQLKDQFGLPPFPLLPATSLVTKLKANYFFADVDCLAAVARSSTPTLFIHGDQDDFVPFAMLEEVYTAAACPKEKLVVPGAAHAKSRETEPDVYWSTVDSFVARFMK